jgi:GTP-binding protein
MEIRSAQFVISSSKFNQLPKDSFPEFAFAGRSNVGKSSLINSLCNRKALARTSSTPGKTQLINHFLINETWYLVDLPGYGYAKVSQKQRAGFLKLMTDYLLKRESLMLVFVLVDLRIPPQAIDLEFIEFLGVEGIPFEILFTKVDKVKQKDMSHNLKSIKAALKESWEELPRMTKTSAISGRGIADVLTRIDECLALAE